MFDEAFGSARVAISELPEESVRFSTDDPRGTVALAWWRRLDRLVIRLAVSSCFMYRSELGADTLGRHAGSAETDLILGSELTGAWLAALWKRLPVDLR